jgi:hypothetical protein
LSQSVVLSVDAEHGLSGAGIVHQPCLGARFLSAIKPVLRINYPDCPSRSDVIFAGTMARVLAIRQS